MIVISSGCPAGVGPELALRAVFHGRARHTRCWLVGDPETFWQAAELVGTARGQLPLYTESSSSRVQIVTAGPTLGSADRNPKRVTPRAGESQLAAVEHAHALAKQYGAPLVTAPVSKAAIARSGLQRARRFTGHTEWLERLDGAPYSVMCFAAPRLVTSLATTHLPLRRVSARLSQAVVEHAIWELYLLLHRLGYARPHLAVASLNPHAGESGLLGKEEEALIVPAIRACRRRLRGKARITGPVGAETAYRLAFAGEYSGVVAMFHDQATIPMKLVAFGQAVNVTMGLSLVRTSPDHGTAYDVAWTGKADPAGMLAAVKLAVRLAQ